VPRLQHLVRLWLAMFGECSKHFRHLGRYPSSRMMRWLHGCWWLKCDRMPVCDVMSTAQSGMGHVVGMVLSGIDVM